MIRNELHFEEFREELLQKRVKVELQVEFIVRVEIQQVHIKGGFLQPRLELRRRASQMRSVHEHFQQKVQTVVEDNRPVEQLQTNNKMRVHLQQQTVVELLLEKDLLPQKLQTEGSRNEVVPQGRRTCIWFPRIEQEVLVDEVGQGNAFELREFGRKGLAGDGKVDQELEVVQVDVLQQDQNAKHVLHAGDYSGDDLLVDHVALQKRCFFEHAWRVVFQIFIFFFPPNLLFLYTKLVMICKILSLVPCFTIWTLFFESSTSFPSIFLKKHELS